MNRDDATSTARLSKAGGFRRRAARQEAATKSHCFHNKRQRRGAATVRRPPPMCQRELLAASRPRDSRSARRGSGASALSFCFERNSSNRFPSLRASARLAFAFAASRGARDPNLFICRMIARLQAARSPAPRQPEVRRGASNSDGGGR